MYFLLSAHAGSSEAARDGGGNREGEILRNPIRVD